MTPTFSSLTDMIKFIRDLPSSTNYGKLITEDFGLSVPNEAKPWEVEYLWKYMIQARTKGVAASDLISVAYQGVKNLFKSLPHISWPKVGGEFVDPSNSPTRVDATIEAVETGSIDLGKRRGARVGSFDASVGECKVIKANGKYVAYIGDVMISNDTNLAQLMKRFAAHGRTFEYSDAD